MRESLRSVWVNPDSTSLPFCASGINLCQQFPRHTLHWPGYLSGFGEHISRLGNFVELGVGKAKAVKGDGILLVVLAFEESGRGLQLSDGCRSLILLDVRVAENGVRDSGRKFARLVGIGIVTLRDRDRPLRIRNRFCDTSRPGIIYAGACQEQ